MGLNHLEKVSERDLEEAGVSMREYDLIVRLMKFDPDLFAYKQSKDHVPYTYLVDISKYSDKKVPQEFKDVFMRPHKMKRLYTQYWRLASDQDLKQR
jgi:hypothetical protein